MNRLKKLFDKNVCVEYAQTESVPNKYGNTQALFFESVPYCGRETTTFAYMGTPNGEKPRGGYPAVVLVHGGGGCAFYEWVEYWNGKGYVALAFDTGGRQLGGREHDSKDTAEINKSGRYVKPDDNGSFGNDEKSLIDSWTYHNVANVILANNILRSNENVNKEKIVLTGISWGGVLTAITSGIDQRFLAFSPVYGTGCLLQSQVFTKNKVPVPKDFETWIGIYDPIVFVPQNKKPMLFTLGMDDAAFSPKNGQRTYERSQGEMYYSYRYALPHYHRWQDDEQMIHISRFMDMYCKGIPLPFEVVGESRDNDSFSVKIKNPENVSSVRFNYTASSDEDCMLWKWERLEIALNNGTATAKIPDETKCCFFELSNGADEEFILSSSMFIIE